MPTPTPKATFCTNWSTHVFRGGKLVSLRAYWDYNKLNDELQKLVGG